MLISFEVENWRSFKKRTKISFVASRERAKNETLSQLPPMYKGTRILPITAIYGPNASGKSSLFEAIGILKHLVVNGTPVNQAIPLVPYKLDSAYAAKPTSFSIEMLIENQIYRYEVALLRTHVVSEALSIKRTRSFEVMFSRSEEEAPVLGARYSTPRNDFVAQGTRGNELFVHNAVAQNCHEFMPVFDWFNSALQVIGTDTQYESYSTMLLRDDFRSFIDGRLRKYNTGADKLVLDDVDVNAIPWPAGLPMNWLDTLPGDEQFAQLRINDTSARGPEIYIFQRRENITTAQKVRLAHIADDGRPITFDIAEESKGTQRLIELLPLFFDLVGIDGSGAFSKVYLVDELDRSFHSRMTADLIESFVARCGPVGRHQLIFSTHDLMIMRGGSLRRDEQWVCEKVPKEGSTLTCVGTHEGVRTDTKILEAYEKGVFGGYPEFYE